MYSVWERSDLSVYSVVKWGWGISRVEHEDFAADFRPHFMKSGVGGGLNVRRKYGIICAV